MYNLVVVVCCRAYSNLCESDASTFIYRQFYLSQTIVKATTASQTKSTTATVKTTAFIVARPTEVGRRLEWMNENNFHQNSKEISVCVSKIFLIENAKIWMHKLFANNDGIMHMQISGNHVQFLLCESENIWENIFQIYHT